MKEIKGRNKANLKSFAEKCFLHNYVQNIFIIREFDNNLYVLNRKCSQNSNSLIFLKPQPQIERNPDLFKKEQILLVSEDNFNFLLKAEGKK